jgi:predicted Zn-dependent protease
MSFLDKAGLTSQGMLEFMQKLGGQELLPADRQAEYVRTHPLTQDRTDAVAHHLKDSPWADKKLEAKFQTMHGRMKAKLLGFLQPETALLRYTDKDPRLPARYARAIALYRTNQLPRALNLTDGLLREEPDNPFFHELKAQMLFENGRVEEAVALYKKAVGLLPSSALLRVAYGHALLESRNNDRLDLAIQQLTEANRLESREPETWRFLAAAWGKKAELTKDQHYEGLVSYALAEEAVARGADQDAKQFADRALKILPKSTPYWLRAQDIKLSVNDAPRR